MVTGPLRIVLWILGALALVWALLALAMLPTMGAMMGDGMMQDGMMGGGMMQEGTMGGGMADGMQCCPGGMMGMMGMMALVTIDMLGLVGIFIYLVIDSLRRRRAAPR